MVETPAPSARSKLRWFTPYLLFPSTRGIIPSRGKDRTVNWGQSHLHRDFNYIILLSFKAWTSHTLPHPNWMRTTGLHQFKSSPGAFWASLNCYRGCKSCFFPDGLRSICIYFVSSNSSTPKWKTQTVFVGGFFCWFLAVFTWGSVMRAGWNRCLWDKEGAGHVMNAGACCEAFRGHLLPLGSGRCWRSVGWGC